MATYYILFAVIGNCLNRRASDGSANLHRFCYTVGGSSQIGSIEGLASVSDSRLEFNSSPAEPRYALPLLTV